MALDAYLVRMLDNLEPDGYPGFAGATGFAVARLEQLAQHAHKASSPQLGSHREPTPFRAVLTGRDLTWYFSGARRSEPQ